MAVNHRVGRIFGNVDYVEFVGEYAPYDLYALENLGRAVDLFEHMSSMMKIEPGTENLPHYPVDRVGHTESAFCRFS